MGSIVKSHLEFIDLQRQYDKLISDHKQGLNTMDSFLDKAEILLFKMYKANKDKVVRNNIREMLVKIDDLKYIRRKNINDL